MLTVEMSMPHSHTETAKNGPHIRGLTVPSRQWAHYTTEFNGAVTVRPNINTILQAGSCTMLSVSMRVTTPLLATLQA